MFKIRNFEDNDDVRIIEEIKPFKVVEYKKDLSVNHSTAQAAYYASEMNVRRRQLVCDVSHSDITIQAGAMQWMVGDVKATSGKSFTGSAASGEGFVNVYRGTGKVLMAPVLQ